MKKALLLCVFLIASCSMQQVRIDSPDPREEQLRSIIAEAEPLIRNLLASLNAGDYASYCRDFDDSAQAVWTEKQFKDLQKKIKKNLVFYEKDKYQVNKIEEYPEFYKIYYFVKFLNTEKHNPVVMALKIRQTASGLKISLISYRHTLLDGKEAGIRPF